jgi:hypothetical protein
MGFNSGFKGLICINIFSVISTGSKMKQAEALSSKMKQAEALSSKMKQAEALSSKMHSPGAYRIVDSRTVRHTHT